MWYKPCVSRNYLGKIILTFFLNITTAVINIYCHSFNSNQVLSIVLIVRTICTLKLKRSIMSVIVLNNNANKQINPSEALNKNKSFQICLLVYFNIIIQFTSSGDDYFKKLNFSVPQTLKTSPLVIL